MHLDDERVQRQLHGQLPPGEAALVDEHLAECPACRARVREVAREESEVNSLLTHLDHPTPPLTADALVTSARVAHTRWPRWAAGILVALGLAGAAYATPGSPLARWAAAAVERMRGHEHPLSPAPAQAPVPDPGRAGIAVAPGRELLILFATPQAEGEARVSLTDGAEVVVRAVTGSATFTSGVDQLLIGNQGSSTSYEIRIPRGAPRVEIRVDGVQIFLKDGFRISTHRPVDATGIYILPLLSPGS